VDFSELLPGNFTASDNGLVRDDNHKPAVFIGFPNDISLPKLRRSFQIVMPKTQPEMSSSFTALSVDISPEDIEGIFSHRTIMTQFPRNSSVEKIVRKLIDFTLNHFPKWKTK
jgi:hypothetical protein